MHTENLLVKTAVLFAGDVEEVDAREDDQKANQEGYHVDGGCGVEALEQNERGDKRASGERHVVEWVDDGCVELVEGLIEVVHLREDADNHHADEYVGGHVGELVIAGKGQLEGNTKGLDGHDGDGTHTQTDGDVDHGVRVAVLGHDLVDGEQRVDSDQEGVEEEPRQGSIVQDFVDGLDLLVWRSVQHNDDGAHKADGTAHSAQNTQLFFQEDGGQNSANNDGKRSQRRHQNSRRKRVSSEIRHLADSHGDDASPPDGVLKILVGVCVVSARFVGRVHEALFRDDEGGADRQRRQHGERKPDVFVVDHGVGVVVRWRCSVASVSHNGKESTHQACLGVR